MQASQHIAASLLLSGVLALGCGGDPEPGPQSEETGIAYRGTLSGAGDESGVLEISVADASSAADVVAKGTITFADGESVELDGTYGASDGLRLSGDGYEVTAEDLEAVLNGNYSGPDGNGTFSIQVAEAEGDVVVFCGTFDGSVSGTWNVVQKGDTLSGSYTSASVGSGWLSGRCCHAMW